jgi:hypothetical protein
VSHPRGGNGIARFGGVLQDDEVDWCRKGFERRAVTGREDFMAV